MEPGAAASFSDQCQAVGNGHSGARRPEESVHELHEPFLHEPLD
jgi:hypothetical protein